MDRICNICGSAIPCWCISVSSLKSCVFRSLLFSVQWESEHSRCASSCKEGTCVHIYLLLSALKLKIKFLQTINTKNSHGWKHLRVNYNFSEFLGSGHYIEGARLLLF